VAGGGRLAVPGARDRVLTLAAGGRLVEPRGRTRGGDGEEAGAGVDRLVVDATVGTTGGLWSGGVPFGLPDDQGADEARSLTYTGRPLDAPLTILGRAAGGPCGSPAARRRTASPCR
jgi:predicted acyl esterase